jgi:hypothetical protein
VKERISETFSSIHEPLKTRFKFLRESSGTVNLVAVIIFALNKAVEFITEEHGLKSWARDVIN